MASSACCRSRRRNYLVYCVLFTLLILATCLLTGQVDVWSLPLLRHGHHMGDGKAPRSPNAKIIMPGPNYFEEKYDKIKSPKRKPSSGKKRPTSKLDKGRYHHIIDSGILDEDARLIVESVIDLHFNPMDTSPDVPPCKGDRLENEVEDILCIPRPKYLKEVKNPCWRDDSQKLRCLPYFHILGLEKSGSSDLWQRLTSHPYILDIDGTRDKEGNWWAWQRYGLFNRALDFPIEDFQDYTDKFRQLAKRVEKSLKNGDDDHKKLVTVDATPSDFLDFRGWSNITQNRGLDKPWVVTPHLMKHFYIHPKFIVIYRDPYERLMSEYHFLWKSKPKSNRDFDLKVRKSIKLLAKCLRNKSFSQCFFDRHFCRALPLRFNLFFYSITINEWFKHFPRESFLFLKTEDYGKNVARTVKKCLEFLDVEPLSSSQLQAISAKKRYLAQNYSQEVPETKELLDAMALPVMRLFEDIIAT